MRKVLYKVEDGIGGESITVAVESSDYNQRKSTEAKNTVRVNSVTSEAITLELGANPDPLRENIDDKTKPTFCCRWSINCTNLSKWHVCFRKGKKRDLWQDNVCLSRNNNFKWKNIRKVITKQ